MADLPAHVPEALARAHAELRAELAADERPAEDMDRLNRLMHRPCMAKVFRALLALLPPDPEPWRRFLADALLASWPAESWRDTIRPARRRFEQRRAAALRAGRELAAALRELTDGMHGFMPPAELKWPANLLERVATRKGYPPEAARRLAEPLAEDDRRKLAARIEAMGHMISASKAAGEMPNEAFLSDYPEPPSVADLLAALLHELEVWKPGPDGGLFPGQTQGGKAPQVYVRALAHKLERLAGSLGIVTPHGKLLSNDNLARVTRAALDLPDEPPGYPYRQPFDEEDVRRALEVPPK